VDVIREILDVSIIWKTDTGWGGHRVAAALGGAPDRNPPETE
jgi:hypothetical protein